MQSAVSLIVCGALGLLPAAALERPIIAANGIVSATGNRSTVAAAPGALLSIFGTSLATSSAAARPDGAGKLPLPLLPSAA